LAASRTDVTVLGFAVSELRHHFVLSIEDAHLAIQIRTHHPLSLRVKVARHAHVRLVYDRLEMGAIQREGLNSFVAPISDGQDRCRSSRIDPKPVRSLKLSISRSRFTDLSEEFSIQRVTQNVAGAVAVAHIEIPVRGKRNIGWDEVNRMLAIA
jgi:hypothetical protein